MNYLPAQDPSSYLDGLNPAQRGAVTFGVQKGQPARSTPPLLIIAGAGTGKTSTLAHRVAHLIPNGADPRRILLLTFTRRMAAEMTRRVEHICATALKGRTFAVGETIEWSGTFHAVGARLLRLYAENIGLEPGFSILDRSDAADLMDLVRDELELSGTGGRFPKKATCLAIYSYAQIPVREAPDRAFPWCAEWAGAAERPVRPLRGGQAGPGRARLRRSAHQHAEADDVGRRMHGAAGITRIVDAGGQTIGDRQPALDLAQHQQAAAGRGPPAVEPGDDLLSGNR